MDARRGVGVRHGGSWAAAVVWWCAATGGLSACGPGAASEPGSVLSDAVPGAGDSALGDDLTPHGDADADAAKTDDAPGPDAPHALVSLSAMAVKPGATVTLSWARPLSAPTGDLFVALKRPGVFAPPRGPKRFNFITGTRPASGPTLYAQADGTWSAKAVPMPPTQASGEIVTPPLDEVGEWRAMTTLRDPNTKRVLSVASATVGVHDKPAVRLHVNRFAMAPGDPLVATVDLLPGSSSKEVVLYAFLFAKKGGLVRNLPSGLEGSAEPAYRGPAKALTIPLVTGPLDLPADWLVKDPPSPTEEFEIAVRLYDEKGALLGVAEAGLTSCIGLIKARGKVVYPDQAPLPSAPIWSRVQFRDEALGVPVSFTTVDPDGTFARELPAGDFSYDVELVDASGLRTAHTNPLRLWECDEHEGPELIVELGPPTPCDTACLGALQGPPPPPPPKGLPAPPPPPPADVAMDGLPKPLVYVTSTAIGDFPEADILEYMTVDVASILKLREPQLLVVSRVDMSTAFSAAAFSMLMGNDESEKLGNYAKDKIAGTQELLAQTSFFINLIGKIEGKKQVSALIDSAWAGGTVKSAGPFQVGDGSKQASLVPAALPLAFQIADVFTKPNSLFSQLRGAQIKPIRPVLTLSVAPASVLSGGTVQASVKLTDYDGTPVAGAVVVITQANPWVPSPLAPSGCTTAANGTCTATLQAPHVTPSSGLISFTGYLIDVSASYTSPMAWLARSNTTGYSVRTPSDVQLAPRRSITRSGQTVVVDVTHTTNGAPAPGTVVALSATLGSFTPQVVTTDASGKATATFSPGPVDGVAVLTAESQSTGVKGTAQVLIDSAVVVKLSASPNAVISPQSALIVGTSFIGGDAFDGLPVTLTASEGTLVPATTTTDILGSFQAVWFPPSSGTGTATVSASVRFGGTSGLDLTSVSFTASSGKPPKPPTLALTPGTHKALCSYHWDPSPSDIQKMWIMFAEVTVGPKSIDLGWNGTWFDTPGFPFLPLVSLQLDVIEADLLVKGQTVFFGKGAPVGGFLKGGLWGKAATVSGIEYPNGGQLALTIEFQEGPAAGAARPPFFRIWCSL